MANDDFIPKEGEDNYFIRALTMDDLPQWANNLINNDPATSIPPSQDSSNNEAPAQNHTNSGSSE